jgi:DNA-binding transcriptional regulator YdaS (Cro superfamily)
MIYQWITKMRPVSVERCIDLEKVTDGVVTCEELRPDVDWAYLRRSHCRCDSVSHDETEAA